MRNYTIFFFNDTATTEIYTLSLHDALPICDRGLLRGTAEQQRAGDPDPNQLERPSRFFERPALLQMELGARSAEHTSELQSRQYIVCRLMLDTTTRRC